MSNKGDQHNVTTTSLIIGTTLGSFNELQLQQNFADRLLSSTVKLRPKLSFQGQRRTTAETTKETELKEEERDTFWEN